MSCLERRDSVGLAHSVEAQKLRIHVHQSRQRLFFSFVGCLCLHNSLADIETYIGLFSIAAGVFQFLLICFLRELPYDQALLNADATRADTSSSYAGSYDPSLDAACKCLFLRCRSPIPRTLNAKRSHIHVHTHRDRRQTKISKMLWSIRWPRKLSKRLKSACEALCPAAATTRAQRVLRIRIF